MGNILNARGFWNFPGLRPVYNLCDYRGYKQNRALCVYVYMYMQYAHMSHYV